MGKSSWVQKAALGCAMKSWHSITFIQQRLLLLPLWGKPADEENFVLGLAGSLQLDLTMLGRWMRWMRWMRWKAVEVKEGYGCSGNDGSDGYSGCN